MYRYCREKLVVDFKNLRIKELRIKGLLNTIHLLQVPKHRRHTVFTFVFARVKLFHFSLCKLPFLPQPLFRSKYSLSLMYPFLNWCSTSAQSVISSSSSVSPTWSANKFTFRQFVYQFILCSQLLLQQDSFHSSNFPQVQSMVSLIIYANLFG